MYVKLSLTVQYINY